jgi:hypothetical protein
MYKTNKLNYDILKIIINLILLYNYPRVSAPPPPQINHSHDVYTVKPRLAAIYFSRKHSTALQRIQEVLSIKKGFSSERVITERMLGYNVNWKAGHHTS